MKPFKKQQTPVRDLTIGLTSLELLSFCDCYQQPTDAAGLQGAS